MLNLKLIVADPNYSIIPRPNSYFNELKKSQKSIQVNLNVRVDTQKLLDEEKKKTEEMARKRK